MTFPVPSPIATSKGRYQSLTMARRRQTIIQAARALLEGGEDSLTILALCERAGVAAKTIYRAFGDREGVILAAVFDHMDTIRNFLAVAPASTDITGVFAEYDWAVAELFRGPEFARIVIRRYFRPRPSETTVRALRSVAENRIRNWLTQHKQGHQLVEGLDTDRLVLFQVDSEYAILHRWASGRMRDDHLADEMKANFLITAIACAREPLRSHCVILAAQLHQKLGAAEIQPIPETF